MKSISPPHIIDIASRLSISAVFTASAIIKALHFDDTIISILGYEIIGINWAYYVAIGLILLESTMSLWGVIGWKKSLFHQVSNTIFIIFIILIVSAWARGLEISCGCFWLSETPDNPRVEYAKDIIRDCVFIVISNIGLWSLGAMRRREVENEH